MTTFLEEEGVRSSRVNWDATTFIDILIMNIRHTAKNEQYIALLVSLGKSTVSYKRNQ
jgi:hypothetical protein